MNKIKLENLSYGAHERNVYDLFIPSELKFKDSIILIIHGGGWCTCDKSAHTKDLEYWCEKGYICSAMNYRYVSPDIHLDDLLDDVSACLYSVKNKLKDLQFNVSKLILKGGSAGAHLSLMYSLTRYDEAPIKPVMVMDNCGPVDLSQPDFLIGINGEFEDWKNQVLSNLCGFEITKENKNSETVIKELKIISPISYINEKTVPIISAHGKEDNLVPVAQVKMLQDKLDEHNIFHDSVIFDGYGHDFDCHEEPKSKMLSLCEKYMQFYL